MTILHCPQVVDDNGEQRKFVSNILNDDHIIFIIIIYLSDGL